MSDRKMPEWVPEPVIQFLAPNESRSIWRNVFHWVFFIISYALYLRITYQFRGMKLFWNMVIVMFVISLFLFFPRLIPSPQTPPQFLLYWLLYFILYVYLVGEVLRHQTLGYRKARDWFYWVVLFFLGSSILLAIFEIKYHFQSIFIQKEKKEHNK